MENEEAAVEIVKQFFSTTAAGKPVTLAVAMAVLEDILPDLAQAPDWADSVLITVRWQDFKGAVDAFAGNRPEDVTTPLSVVARTRTYRLLEPVAPPAAMDVTAGPIVLGTATLTEQKPE